MKLTITGKPTYINKMYAHLRKEHPSTRTRMIKGMGEIDKESEKGYKQTNPYLHPCKSCARKSCLGCRHFRF